ncbi:helix-turn-helix transcriptional regulator, partial [Frankia sp. CNm7]|uniref:helix-turn-helix transcriptional regulator n=1 Tax=Frankia nepalensis TaxID=1836974 RepID=UPI001DB91109|nr:helix-turn-helix transcriptional regulator [Frankia nepalensis]
RPADPSRPADPARPADPSRPAGSAGDLAAIVAELARPDQGARMVLVDDLHLLDATSARLLRDLLDAEAIRLIVTVRAGEPVGDEVTALLATPLLRLAELTELDQEAVDGLLRAVLGGPASRRALGVLYQASGGNPLYLRELVHGHLRAGTLAGDGEVWHLSEDPAGEGRPVGTAALTELIDTHLGMAGAAGLEVLDTLALCGPLPEADLRAAGQDHALSELVGADLIRFVADGRRTLVTLTHPIYDEILRGRIGELRARMLLGRQIDRVEAHGARRRDDALHVATWRLAATGTADPALLARAASQAQHAGDFQRVRSLLEALPASAHTAATRGMLALTLADFGEWERADELLGDLAAASADEGEVLLLTVARATSLLWGAGRADLALAANAEGRARITDPASLRVVQVTEGTVRALSGEPTRGLALLGEHLPRDHRELADVNAWLHGATAAGMALAATGRAAEGMDWAEHAYETHRRLETAELVSQPVTTRLTAVFALGECGRLTEARALGQACVDAMMPTGTASPRAWGALYLGRVEWLAGHLTEARRWYAEAAAVARNQRHHQVEHLALIGLTASAAALGDLAAADEARGRAAAHRPLGFLAGEDRLGEAWSQVARGHLALAREILLESAGRARDTGHLSCEGLLLTELARLGGARAAAARLAEIARIAGDRLAAARAELAGALAARAPARLLAVADELEELGADLLAAEAAT